MLIGCPIGACNLMLCAIHDLRRATSPPRSAGARAPAGTASAAQAPMPGWHWHRRLHRWGLSLGGRGSERRCSLGCLQRCSGRRLRSGNATSSAPLGVRAVCVGSILGRWSPLSISHALSYALPLPLPQPLYLSRALSLWVSSSARIFGVCVRIFGVCVRHKFGSAAMDHPNTGLCRPAGGRGGAKGDRPVQV